VSQADQTAADRAGEQRLGAENPFIRAMSRRDVLSDEERQVFEALPMRVRVFEADEEIVREATRPTESCLVLEGFAARAHFFATGKRQLAAIHVAGDFVDLHSLLLKFMDHAVIALSRCRVAFVPHANLRAITESHPHLGRMLWLSTTIDGAIQRSWATSLGRRSVQQHLAHLICEVYTRLEWVEAARDLRFDFPVSQAELGDMLGLSIVHVNRTVRDLRATGLVNWRGHGIEIPDFDRLADFAEFDPAYLNLISEPR
jgi:CRP-like cAMP-binding protein